MRPSSATAAPRGSGFGARLREARETAGLSQGQLGERIGKTKDAVSQWERDVMGVSWETLRTIAAVLTVDEYWLRDGQPLATRSPRRPKAPLAIEKTLARMERRLVRLEQAMLVILDEAHHAAGDDQVADELVSATRRAKALLAEDLDAEGDAPASEAEPDTHDEADATTGSA